MSNQLFPMQVTGFHLGDKLVTIGVNMPEEAIDKCLMIACRHAYIALTSRFPLYPERSCMRAARVGNKLLRKLGYNSTIATVGCHIRHADPKVQDISASAENIEIEDGEIGHVVIDLDGYYIDLSFGQFYRDRFGIHTPDILIIAKADTLKLGAITDPVNGHKEWAVTASLAIEETLAIIMTDESEHKKDLFKEFNDKPMKEQSAIRAAYNSAQLEIAVMRGVA